MATKLNKNRMLLTRVLVVFVLVASFFTAPKISDQTVVYHAIRMLGYVLLIACAIGRIYSTAFIGGVKNKELIKQGPYSMCRNPLYFYSLLGAAGLGLVSAQLSYFALLFFSFLIIYNGLISREEEFLEKTFGADFEKFKKTVPKLFPNFKKFKASKELTFQPKYFNYAIRDAIWWFVPYPIFELIRYLHNAEIIKPLFYLW